MNTIRIDIKNALPFVDKDEFENLSQQVIEKNAVLKNRTGKGNEFLGWIDLPSRITESELNDIKTTAESLRNQSQVIVVIGIGGSYLGSKAVIEALSGQFDHLNNKSKPLILFAGQNLSEDYHYELLDFLKDKSFSIVVISKSGTTTEPAIAFRLLRAELEKRLGTDEASKHIVAITDSSKGALRELADKENYKTFTIDDNIGGRYSVLSPVGLLPIACAGFDINKLVDGARVMQEITSSDDFDKNPAYQYAAIRNALYAKNYSNEILVNYNPKLNFISEWWKQLFGESEGKENKGIFPASASFSTDLHSLGQYIQEGKRNLFETVISVENTKYNLLIPDDEQDLDKLNYLKGKPIDYVNKMAELGTTIAHIDGGVPNILISMPEINELFIGQLLYFFEISCALSGYLLNINPFDQPGVEAYKKNMFALLEKPGFEKETKDIKKRANR